MIILEIILDETKENVLIRFQHSLKSKKWTEREVSLAKEVMGRLPDLFRQISQDFGVPLTKFGKGDGKS